MPRSRRAGRSSCRRPSPCSSRTSTRHDIERPDLRRRRRRPSPRVRGRRRTRTLDVEAFGQRLALEFSFRSRHNATNALAALAAYRALGLPLEEAGRGRRRRRRFRAGARRSVPLPGGGAAHQRLLQREPDVDGGGARASRRSARGGPPARRGSRRHGRARPGAPAYHGEVGAAASRAGVEVLVAVGPLARGYLEGAEGGRRAPLGADAERGRPDAARRLLQAGRLRARQGLPLGRARGRRGRDLGGARRLGARAWSRSSSRGILAMVISIVAGPKFIEFLRRNEFGQHIREEGPQGHVAKQGTPDDGRAADHGRHGRAVSRLLRPHARGADRLLRHARLRRDRLRRRLDRSSRTAARSGSAGRWKLALLLVDHGLRRGRRATSSTSQTDVYCRCSTSTCRSRGAGTCSSSS